MTVEHAPIRIDQQGERLYTVRPRSMASTKRGEACAFKLHVPDKDLSGFTKQLQYDSERKAFKALTRGQTSTESDVSGTNVESSAISTNSTDTNYIDFIVQSVAYQIQERSEILHTFGGKEAVYFYGEAPVLVNIQGILADDLDNDQYGAFMNVYHKFLAGSAAAREYSAVEFMTPNSTFVGAFLSLNITQSAERDTDVQFSAQILAKSFTFKSTDSFFKNEGDSSAIVPIKIGTRVDPDPTVTQEQVNASKMASVKKSAVTGESGFPSLPVSNSGPVGEPGDPSFLEEFTATIQPPDWYTTGVSATVDFISSGGELIEEIGEFFDDIFDLGAAVFDLLDPALDVLDSITELGDDLIGFVEDIESGVDGLLNEVITVTEKIWHTVETLEDAVTTVMNFPSSISESVKSAMYQGKRSSDEMATLGSGSVSSDEAARLLSSSGNIVGAARGTPQGNAAVLLVSRGSNIPTINTLISAKRSTSEEIPSIPIGG